MLNSPFIPLRPPSRPKASTLEIRPSIPPPRGGPTLAGSHSRRPLRLSSYCVSRAAWALVGTTCDSVQLPDCRLASDLHPTNGILPLVCHTSATPLVGCEPSRVRTHARAVSCDPRAGSTSLDAPDSSRAPPRVLSIVAYGRVPSVLLAFALPSIYKRGRCSLPPPNLHGHTSTTGPGDFN